MTFAKAIIFDLGEDFTGLGPAGDSSLLYRVRKPDETYVAAAANTGLTEIGIGVYQLRLTCDTAWGANVVLDWEISGTPLDGTDPDLPVLNHAIDLIELAVKAQTDNIGTNAADSPNTQTMQGRVDVAVSTRSTYAGADTGGTTTLLGRLTSGRAGNLDNLDAQVSSRLASGGYTAPPSAATIADAVWNALTSSLTTAGSVGKRLVDFVTTLVYSAPLTEQQTADAMNLDSAGSAAAGSVQAKLDMATAAVAPQNIDIEIREINSTTR